MAEHAVSEQELANREHVGPTKTGDNIAAKRVAGYVWNGSSWERQSTGFAANADITTTVSSGSVVQTDGTKIYTVTFSGDTITEVWS